MATTSKKRIRPRPRTSARKQPLAAVVLAAGLGKRMRSDLPKVLHRVAGRTLIGHVLSALEALGVERTVVVVGHGADAVRAEIGDRAVCVVQEPQLGTGHALAQARAALRGFRGDVLVLCGDVPLIRPATLKRLLSVHRRRDAQVTVLGMTVDDPTGYGRLLQDNDGHLRIVEHADASARERDVQEVNSGTYCFDWSFVTASVSRLRRDNAGGEFYLTDLVEIASSRGRAAMLVLDDDSETLGINTRLDLARAEATMQDRIVMGWMREGVTFLDPTTAYVSIDTVIGRDAVVGPNVRLDGSVRIGPRCRLDGSCHLTDTQIGADCHVKWGVVADQARVGAGARLGPYAHLRPEATLGPEVHIGNFVEVKKSHIGRGSKANHLTYIGDSEIGEEVNVGAGTITCNYDGFRKHRTVIGDRVQIGSDTQLVAPVELGDDCFVAAGTTVMKDVESGALVFNDKKQMTRSGWVSVFRRRARIGKGAKG